MADPTPDETPDYLAHYRGLIDEKGAGFEATGWRNADFQRERFRVFCAMQAFTDRVVLDAGAGRADFAVHLLEEGIHYERFIAMDAMAEMTELVRQRSIPRLEGMTLDFAGDARAFERFNDVDVIVFSGSLNTFEQPHALRVLENAWAATREALVFNFLSARCPVARRGDDTGPAHRFDPLALLDWALDQTPLVQFRQDYLGGHDATIAMRREPDGG
jgi:hypothetical protein